MVKKESNLKIAHLRKRIKNDTVRALAEIFKANDLRRQEKRVEQLKKQKHPRR